MGGELHKRAVMKYMPETSLQSKRRESIGADDERKRKYVSVWLGTTKVDEGNMPHLGRPRVTCR